VIHPPPPDRNASGESRRNEGNCQNAQAGWPPAVPRVLARFIERELCNFRRVSPMGGTANALECTRLHNFAQPGR